MPEDPRLSPAQRLTSLVTGAGAASGTQKSVEESGSPRPKDGFDEPRVQVAGDPSVASLVRYAGEREGVFGETTGEGGERSLLAAPLAALEARTLHLAKGLVVPRDVLIELLTEAVALAPAGFLRGFGEFQKELLSLPAKATSELFVCARDQMQGLTCARKLLELLYRRTPQGTKKEQISAAGSVLLRAEQLSEKFSFTWTQLRLAEKCDVLRCLSVFGRTRTEAAQRAVVLTALIQGFQQGRRPEAFARAPGETGETVNSLYARLWGAALELSELLGESAAAQTLRLSPEIMDCVVNIDQQLVIARYGRGLTEKAIEKEFVISYAAGNRLREISKQMRQLWRELRPGTEEPPRQIPPGTLQQIVERSGFEAWMVESVLQKGRISGKATCAIRLLAGGMDRRIVAEQLSFAEKYVSEFVRDAGQMVSHALVEQFPQGAPKRISRKELEDVAGRACLAPSSVQYLLKSLGCTVEVGLTGIVGLVSSGQSQEAVAERLGISQAKVSRGVRKATAEMDGWLKARFPEGVPEELVPELLSVIAEEMDLWSTSDVTFLFERLKQNQSLTRTVTAQDVVALVANGMSQKTAAERLGISSETVSRRIREATDAVMSRLKSDFPEDVPEEISLQQLRAVAADANFPELSVVYLLEEATPKVTVIGLEQAAKPVVLSQQLADVVSHVAQGASMGAVSVQFGIPRTTITRWVDKAQSAVIGWLNAGYPEGSSTEMSPEVLAAIAREVGLRSPSDVQFLLQRARANPKPPVAAADVVALAATGLSLRAVGERLGISHPTASRRIQDATAAVMTWLSRNSPEAAPEEMPPEMLAAIAKDAGLRSSSDVKFLLSNWVGN